MPTTSETLQGLERKGRRRSLALIAVLVTAVVAGSTWLQAVRLADLRLFDLFSTLATAPVRDDVVIVAIDEPSFAEIGLQWPWPRSLHGDLVEALRAAGARAIGIDLIFAEPSTPEADRALAAALAGDTVLAADENLIDTPHATQLVRTEPLPMFTETGALTGIATLPVDADGTVRRLPGAPDGFARQVAAAAGLAVPEAGPGAMMAVAGPARTIPTVSYYQALDPVGFLPPGRLKDRIVLVGLSLQSAPTVDDGGADAFTTSYTPRSERLVPGVEVQATILSNLLAGTYLQPAGRGVALAAIAAAALLGAIAVRRETSAFTFIPGALGVAGLVLGSLLLLWAAHVWVSPIGPVLAFAGVLAVRGGEDFARERRTRRTVTNAFRHYLSPEMVERLARDPTLLRTGGERRTLSILFCDVRGFTAIAERMKGDPDRLTGLVNRLLDPLSEQILAHGGTIDKYIGDCVMAFWNAPLDDPDHALHAVAAALGMAEAAERFGRLIEAEARENGQDLPPIAVGVGINTGEVVVGNMGSSRRFDYSVLGDAVNLASRLEGTCRVYEVPVVIGEDTRRHVSHRFATALLDRVVVKGRTEAVAVHTVLGPVQRIDADLLALHHVVVEDALAGRLAPADPRLSALSDAFPELAAFYRRLSPKGTAA